MQRYDSKLAATNHQRFQVLASEENWEEAFAFLEGLGRDELIGMLAFAGVQIKTLEWVLEAAGISPEQVELYAKDLERELLKTRMREATKELERDGNPTHSDP